MTMIEGAKPVSELVERLTKRALDVECAVVEFRDIGGRNALDKADALLAEFRLLREAAAALERAERDAGRLREYLNAAATDYEGAMKTIREQGADFMPKTVMDMAESVTMLRRATGGEDVWSEYESEMVALRKRHREELERAERERDEAREARDACAQALFDVSDNVHHCGEQYMTNPPMCVRAHNARMALQRITQKHVLSQTQGEEESST